MESRELFLPHWMMHSLLLLGEEDAPVVEL